MSAKTLRGVMIAGSVAVLWLTPRRAEPPATRAPGVRVHERPWLTREAAARKQRYAER